MIDKDDPSILIDEVVAPNKKRRGGIANLILISLILEATRMLDDGFDVGTVEEAAKMTFGISKGFLSVMDDLGIPEVVNAMEHLSDTSDPEDPLTCIFKNFFAPAKSAQMMLEEYNKNNSKSYVAWVGPTDIEKTASDFLCVQVLGLRYKAVAFMIAAELVESGVAELPVVEKICRDNFLWSEGPFAMMNRIGIGEALRIVTERMTLSHRLAINFPVPKLLILQAQKNTPWDES